MIDNLFNLIFCCSFILLVIIKPKAAIFCFLGLIWLLPAQFLQFGFAFGYKEKYISNYIIFTLVFVIAYFFRLLRTNKKCRKTDLLILVYIFFGVLSSIIITKKNVDLSFTAFVIRKFAILPLFFFIGKYYLLTDGKSSIENKILSLSKFLIFVGVYISFFGLFEYVTHFNLFAELSRIWTNFIGSKSILEGITNEARFILYGFYRYSGVYIESTITPMMLMMPLAFLLSRELVKKMRFKRVRNCLIVCFFGMILLSGTRGVILATLLLFATNALFSSRTRKLLFVTVVIISFISLTLGLLMIDSIKSSVFYKVRLAENMSYFTRLTALEKGINIFLSNPIMGVGFGTPINAIEYEGGDIYTTHNFYLDKLVFLGVVGTLFFIVLLTKFLRNAGTLLMMGKIPEIRYFSKIFLLVSISLLTVYTLNPEHLPSGSVFWMMAGMIDQMKHS